jgi:hypothetical protein
MGDASIRREAEPEMELKYYPDRVLRKKTRPIQEVDDEVMERARQMLDLMYEEEGVGLAGPQVGWGRRIITVDIEGAEPEGRVFINPTGNPAPANNDSELYLLLPGQRVRCIFHATGRFYNLLILYIFSNFRSFDMGGD